MKVRRKINFLVIVASSLIYLSAHAQSNSSLPRPEPAFKGKIERTVEKSIPDFPKEVQAPLGAPNILLIITDDVGFGGSSTFGGPIPTPTLDQLAQNGLRFNQFHTTALCSPTRAALITGRNHHTAATGSIMEFATGFPGYNTLTSPDIGSVGSILKYNGYTTAWFGKNHNVPDWHTSQAGPFRYWPSALGFDYFFGFIGGDADQWHTPIFENNIPYEAPEQLGPNPKHFDEILANKAIHWIQLQHSLAPQKPFFVYYATGTAHSPHHAPKAWIDKFKGKFDQGWDKVREETLVRQKKGGIVPSNTALTLRPKEIPAWASLSADQKKLYAHMMEVYAGALGHADYQIGRIIKAITDLGELNNTVIIYIMGDNGASAEGTLQGTSNEVGVAANGVQESLPFLLSIMNKLGSPLTYNHYPVGWAHAMDAPFQWTKQIASHFGGTRNGLVIFYPKKITDKGGLRSQFSHVTDIVPTLLELTGIQFPSLINGVKQKPLEGASLVYTFNNPSAKTRHPIQYFEMFSNRGLYADGWMASTTPLRLPWATYGSSPNPDDFKWELYHVAEDFSQAHNLAESQAEKLKHLQELFDKEAKKYQVYPLDARFAERADPATRPSLNQGRNDFIYYSDMIRIPEGTAPDIKNKSFKMTAEVEIPKQEKVEGILGTMGGRYGGWALLILDGKPEFAYAYSNQSQDKYRIRSPFTLSPGKHIIEFDFKYDGGGIGKGGTGILYVDGKQVAEGRVEHTIRARFSLDETMDFGQDTGTPVIENYLDKMPFKFSGKLNKFTIHLNKDNLQENEKHQVRQRSLRAWEASE
jgi:arylsulfatase